MEQILTFVHFVHYKRCLYDYLSRHPFNFNSFQHLSLKERRNHFHLNSTPIVRGSFYIMIAIAEICPNNLLFILLDFWAFDSLWKPRREHSQPFDSVVVPHSNQQVSVSRRFSWTSRQSHWYCNSDKWIRICFVIHPFLYLRCFHKKDCDNKSIILGLCDPKPAKIISYWQH